MYAYINVTHIVSMMPVTQIVKYLRGQTDKLLPHYNCIHSHHIVY